MKEFFKYTFASALGLLIALFILTIVGIISLAGFATYTAATSQKPIKENSILHLKLEGSLVERTLADNPFGDLFSNYAPSNLGLNDVLSSIEKSATDPNIKGIFIETAGMTAGLASSEEIRNALIRFKESNKFIVAYGDIITEREYYLASVADQVIINPVGMIELNGLCAQGIYFKNLLEKLGVTVQVVKVGTYKSAVEPFILDKMSDANREQTASYVNTLWNDVVESISQSRKIQPSDINTMADAYQLFQPTEEYITNRLVDKQMYRSEVDSLLKEMSGIEQTEKLRFVKVTEMANSTSSEKEEKSKVAVLYAEGEIDGTDPTEGIQSEDLCKEIAKIKKDEDVKAVVFRVNSPGGSAYGSEQIWYEIEQLKAEKPVVVSMGDYAASGGYYISCGADYVFAQPTTLTGSIGVFAMIPNTEKLTEKLGLSFDEYKTNEMAGFPSLTREMTTSERNLMQAYTDRTYELFVKRCADGRKKSPEGIKTIAEGRVWSGRQAIELGLVDELGNIDDAIKKAANIADVENYSTIEYPKKKEFIDILMEELGQDTETKVAKMVLGDEYQIYKTLQMVKGMQGIQARIPYELKID